MQSFEPETDSIRFFLLHLKRGKNPSNRKRPKYFASFTSLNSLSRPSSYITTVEQLVTL